VVEDSKLEKLIRDAFIEDERLSEHPIDVSVADGMVTLRGAVQSYRRKLAAHEIAASFEGCRGVRNELTVEPAGPVPDEEVAGHVRSALDSHADITKEVITVAARNGTVTLSGNVRSHVERVVAEDVARAAKGVRDVNNLLLVDIPREIEDEALGREIQEALRHARGLRDTDLRVAVHDDAAVLSGLVEELWQREAAEAVVRRYRVSSIRNEIIVTGK
jgi:osmotically-inducible protein OsmY